jgi:regulation of enolase protein 1 (concanavalin A-like superfamily)
VTSLARHYPAFSIHPDLNFPPDQDFGKRAVDRYSAETQRIDAIIFRITDRRHTDALIAARGRGVPIRIITEPQQYRDPTRLWHAWNVDRLYAAGIQVRHRKHLGTTHEKLALLYGQGMTIIGSSNWTTPSATSQLEHNYFSRKSWMFTWGRQHFDRKWTNGAGAEETQAFVPLPPDTPKLVSPADGAQDQSTTVTLRWYAGPWAHKYDVYIGTSPSTLVRVLGDRELGPSLHATDYESFTVSGLAQDTIYYWLVVGRTMANVERTSSTWSFRTQGTASSSFTLPSGWASQDVGAVAATGSAGHSNGVYTLSGSGADIWGTADEFHFAYRTLSGDGTIVARVASVQNVDPWTKAGVMMRETLSAGSKHASMFVTQGKGLAFQRRTSTNGTSSHTSGGGGTAPYWVRISRSGNTFTAYVSTNGSSWTLVGSASTLMTSTIYVGLALTSHKDGVLATATFDNVGITD